MEENIIRKRYYTPEQIVDNAVSFIEVASKLRNDGFSRKEVYSKLGFDSPARYRIKWSIAYRMRFIKEHNVINQLRELGYGDTDIKIILSTGQWIDMMDINWRELYETSISR